MARRSGSSIPTSLWPQEWNAFHMGRSDRRLCVCVSLFVSLLLCFRGMNDIEAFIGQADAQSLPWHAAKALLGPFTPDQGPIIRDGGSRGV